MHRRLRSTVPKLSFTTVPHTLLEVSIFIINNWPFPLFPFYVTGLVGRRRIFCRCLESLRQQLKLHRNRWWLFVWVWSWLRRLDEKENAQEKGFPVVWLLILSFTQHSGRGLAGGSAGCSRDSIGWRQEGCGEGWGCRDSNSTYTHPSLFLSQVELPFSYFLSSSPHLESSPPSHVSKPSVYIDSETVFDICVTSLYLKSLESWLLCELCDLTLGQVIWALRISISSAVSGGNSNAPAPPASVHKLKYSKRLCKCRKFHLKTCQPLSFTLERMVLFSVIKLMEEPLWPWCLKKYWMPS